MRLEPLFGVDLVGADDRADFVVEDLGRGSGQRGEPERLRLGEILRERYPVPAGALGDLERGEAVHVDVGCDALHEPDHVEVVVAVEVGVDPTLEADLGGTAVDRLLHPGTQLVGAEEVRVAPEVQRQRALREGAEPALERADVGVVDVAVPHEGDGVADDVAPELVGDLGDALHVGAACLQAA